MDPILQSVREMGGGISLDLDHTFWSQLVLVIVLIGVLKRLIFDPYLQTLEEREQRTGKTREEASNIRNQAEAAAGRYRSDLEAARAKALNLRARLRTEGLEAKDAQVTAARAEANETIQEARVQLEAELKTARKALASRVDELSEMVVEKVLGQRS